MYEYLEGELVSRSAARVVIDVGGVGYDLAVPLGATFPTGERARVWTHLVVRDDAHLLYGFPDRAWRELFRMLLLVRGIGPAVALGILSGLPREELVLAIATGDLRRLTQIRGVGKKTAEQIVLDLRERITLLADDHVPARGPKTAAPSAGNVEDAVAALVSVGFKPPDARKQVERAAEHVDPNDLELLVRTALQH